MNIAKSTLLALSLAVLGVASVSTPAQADDDAPATVTVSKGKAVVGQASDIVIHVAPKAGFHFNEEFPSDAAKDQPDYTIAKPGEHTAGGDVTIHINAKSANPKIKFKTAVCKNEGGQCRPYTTMLTISS